MFQFCIYIRTYCFKNSSYLLFVLLQLLTNFFDEVNQCKIAMLPEKPQHNKMSSKSLTFIVQVDKLLYRLVIFAANDGVYVLKQEFKQQIIQVKTF